jgi:hypothetical protein
MCSESQTDVTAEGRTMKRFTVQVKVKSELAVDFFYILIAESKIGYTRKAGTVLALSKYPL